MRLLAAARGRIRGWLGDERLGMLDYWRRPEWRETWGGPFNGQAFRQRLFVELCSRVAFAAIIETGTYRGSTTAYFRQATRVPVHSFELKPRHHGFARARLWLARDAHLHRGDSRAGIAALARSGARPHGPVFFYLDAHWEGDLPLREEVDLAFAHWRQAVAMIDDFAVPDDPGYGFDNYGPGQALTLAYLGPRAAPRRQSGSRPASPAPRPERGAAASCSPATPSSSGGSIRCGRCDGGRRPSRDRRATRGPARSTRTHCLVPRRAAILDSLRFSG